MSLCDIMIELVLIVALPFVPIGMVNKHVMS